MFIAFLWNISSLSVSFFKQEIYTQDGAHQLD